VKLTNDEKEKPFYNRSLERALRILNAFDTSRPALSLAQISDLLDLPRATVLRLCSTLIKFNYLRQDPLSKKYSLGFRVIELAGSFSDSFSFKKIASPYLGILQTRLKKTTFLGVLDNDEVLYIDKRDDPGNPISFTSSIGARRPPYWGMMGSILMAYLPGNEIKRILQKNPLTAATRRSITRKDEFIKWLSQVRSQGFAVDVETALDGITGVAAPVFDHQGKVVAGIGVGFISSSVNEKELNTIIKEVIKAAMDISRELGFTG
jgi:DNA-binding IclR family transcriptional regulator